MFLFLNVYELIRDRKKRTIEKYRVVSVFRVKKVYNDLRVVG